MFKKILPVGIGILLIILISVGVVSIKKISNRTPSFADADKTYLSYGDLNVTNDMLYTYMRKNYGVSELLNMVDKALFKEEIDKVDVNSEDYKKYLNKEIFGDEDLEKVKEPQDKWDDILMSLRASKLLTKQEAEDSSDYTKETSRAWEVIKDYYKLGFARKEWAKGAYLDKYKEDRDSDKWFDETKAENSTNSIQSYYEEHYKGNVTGLFIPFTSKEAALEMMERHGINTNSNVLTEDGWVSKDYDYNSDAKLEESDYLSYQAVVKAFFAMYNEVLGYLNDGQQIITDEKYSLELNEKKTAYNVKASILKALDIDFGQVVNLPTTVTVNGKDAATITWKLEETSFAELNDAVLTGKFGDNKSVEVTLKFTVKFGEAEIEGEEDIELVAKKEDEAETVTTVTPKSVDPFESIILNKEFVEDPKINGVKFNWTYDEAIEINKTLANYLSVDSTKLTLSEDPKNFYKSYTITPVEVGNYYFLIIKLDEKEAPELFEMTEDDEVKQDDEGNYIIKDQDLYDEIVEAMKKELLTDNNINDTIYQFRRDHNVKIFDSYMEAMYEYEYKYFYETTLKKTDYNKYKKSKKNQKSVVVSYQTEAGNKKSTVKIEAKDLFDVLYGKYAQSVTTSIVENYLLITNKEFNNIYNPYTDTVLDEDTYKLLLNSEISTLRKNFESDYFTYSYLAYYGFTPNFGHKYGWKKFIKDYFNSYNDQQLLTSSVYGGSIYADAFEQFTDSLYGYDRIKEEMDKALADYYSLNVVNFMVQIDYNYNSDEKAENAADILLEEKDNWTDTQRELAKELSKFVYERASETNLSSIYEQLKEIVKLYNEADYDYDETAWNEAKANNTSIYDFNYWGKYKKAGLTVKVEAANSYDASSQIYEEFADECRKLYAKAKDLNLLGTTFDVPLISEEAFTTDYGYHMIAAIGAGKPEDLPTEQEIQIFRANELVKKAQEAVDAAQKSIDEYSASGFVIASYEAQLKLAKQKLAKYQDEEKALLKELGLEEDYKLSDEANAKLKAWYTPAEKKIEEGTLVTEEYVKQLEENLAANKFNFTDKTQGDELQKYLDILKDEIVRQNKED